MANSSGELDWVASIDFEIVRVHQHGATLPRIKMALRNCKKSGIEPPDHDIGRSRRELTTKSHLMCDGKCRALTFVLTAGQVADTVMLPATSAFQVSLQHLAVRGQHQLSTLSGTDGNQPGIRANGQPPETGVHWPFQDPHAP
jgi:hypothetical protein